MKRKVHYLVLVLSSFLLQAAHAADEEFPLRSRYPDVEVLSTEALNQRFNDVLVVDVRSKYEFETLHIKDAVNVPLTTGFGEAMLKLRAQHNKPFVFYCNGKTCHKSYDAALLAARARLNNLYAYDAGILEWSMQQPEKTALLGRSPVKTQDLIDEKTFKAHLLEPREFVSRVDAKSIVLDVRDRAQRDNPLFPMKEQRAQLDETKKIDAVIDEARTQNKTLLIYDQTGKQVQWFQYYLESKGLKKYYFMKGGAQEFFDSTLGKVVLGSGESSKLQAN